VEELVTSKPENETADGVRAMYVGALIILGTFARTDRKRMMAINLDPLAPYEGTARDKRP
jgi:hypothetical protein